MAITMKDIAEMAGVSQPAVSAVLNNKTNCRVSGEKRQTILRLAEELNFKRNHSAMQLRGMQTKTVAILSGNYPSVLHSELFRELNNNLLNSGYQSYYAAVSDPRHLKKIVTEFICRGVEGIVSYYINFNFEKSNCPVPLVAISNHTDNYDIAIDSEHGGYLAGRHLISHGHARLGIVGTGVSSNSGKVKGFCKALGEAGLEFDDKWIIELTHNINAPKQILDVIKNQKITAFFTTNDSVGGKLIAFLLHHGFKVPSDIAVIGFDGMSFCEFTASPLTTIVQPFKKLGEKSVEILMEKIKNQDLSRRQPVLIKPELFIGSSCGCNKHNLDMIYWEGTLPTLETLYNYIEPIPKTGEQSK
jgi:DNA-binding LacI/PurR family transcriptional regulator